MSLKNAHRANPVTTAMNAYLTITIQRRAVSVAPLAMVLPLNTPTVDAMLWSLVLTFFIPLFSSVF
jgi:hypothetical protein